MKRMMSVGLLALAGCGVAPHGASSGPVGAETGVSLPLAGVTSTYDAGGEGQYPATVWHYPGSVQEDEAGDDCDWRGGSLVDDASERWVCVTD